MESVLPWLLWGGLFFLMMRFGCGSHLFGRGHGHGQGSKQSNGGHAHAGGCCGPNGGDKADHSAANEALRWEAPDKDLDRVCDRTIPTVSAKSSIHDGQVYYFCSRECREQFEAAPRLYLNETGKDDVFRRRIEHRPAGGSSHA